MSQMTWLLTLTLKLMTERLNTNIINMVNKLFYILFHQIIVKKKTSQTKLNDKIEFISTAQATECLSIYRRTKYLCILTISAR